MTRLSDLQAELAQLEADLAKQETIAAVGKISANGSFGKLGNKWSILYSPELLIQVTLTGQLALLMLIEQLESAGVSVVSGNTDGIVLKHSVDLTETVDGIVDVWEMITGFEIETTGYSAMYSKDVNNYLAIKPDGKFKSKGAYAIEGLQKNPRNVVCIEAVIALLNDGVLIEDTINACTDVRKFLTAQKVEGGAVNHWGDYLGKVVRWYYAKEDPNDMMGNPRITYAKNGNLVPRTEGCRPLMELPEGNVVPADLDYDWYVKDAQSMLKDLGVEYAIETGW